MKILAKAKLIDYSMFIVIAERKKRGPNKLLGNRMFNSTINNNYVYLLGIIDYLTFYGFRKQLENFVRTCGKKNKEVSCVPPKRYRDRFYNFMFKHVLISDNEEQEEQDEITIKHNMLIIETLNSIRINRGSKIVYN